MEPQKIQIAKASLSKESGVPEFRLHYKATMIKTVCYWHKTRTEHQWSRKEPRNIYTHGQLINKKDDKNIQQGKDTLK